jgi:cobalamin biosynthesis Co2+ chelatase CbiK
MINVSIGAAICLKLHGTSNELHSLYPCFEHLIRSHQCSDITVWHTKAQEHADHGIGRLLRRCLQFYGQGA